MPSLTQIRIFPVKSLRGATHAAAAVEPWGLAGDRRWLVTTPDYHFLTQREHARMALIEAETTADGLILTAPGAARLAIPHPQTPAVTVTIWRDTVAAQDAGDAPAA